MCIRQLYMHGDIIIDLCKSHPTSPPVLFILQNRRKPCQLSSPDPGLLLDSSVTVDENLHTAVNGVRQHENTVEQGRLTGPCVITVDTHILRESNNTICACFELS